MADEMKFRDEPVRTVYRHWLCPKEGCDGEMVSTGQGISQLYTTWDHRCDKCNYREGARSTYPGIVHNAD